MVSGPSKKSIFRSSLKCHFTPCFFGFSRPPPRPEYGPKEPFFVPDPEKNRKFRSIFWKMVENRRKTGFFRGFSPNFRRIFTKKCLGGVLGGSDFPNFPENLAVWTGSGWGPDGVQIGSRSGPDRVLDPSQTRPDPVPTRSRPGPDPVPTRPDRTRPDPDFLSDGPDPDPVWTRSGPDPTRPMAGFKRHRWGSNRLVVLISRGLELLIDPPFFHPPPRSTDLPCICH